MTAELLLVIATMCHTSVNSSFALKYQRECQAAILACIKATKATAEVGVVEALERCMSNPEVR